MVHKSRVPKPVTFHQDELSEVQNMEQIWFIIAHPSVATLYGYMYKEHIFFLIELQFTSATNFLQYIELVDRNPKNATY